jgi:uncharacterized membrane protein
MSSMRYTIDKGKWFRVTIIDLIFNLGMFLCFVCLLWVVWIQKYNHAQMHEAISDQNLELLRERLIQTVKLTSDVDDIERPPLQGM